MAAVTSLAARRFFRGPQCRVRRSNQDGVRAWSARDPPTPAGPGSRVATGAPAEFSRDRAVQARSYGVARGGQLGRLAGFVVHRKLGGRCWPTTALESKSGE